MAIRIIIFAAYSLSSSGGNRGEIQLYAILMCDKSKNWQNQVNHVYYHASSECLYNIYKLKD